MKTHQINVCSSRILSLVLTVLGATILLLSSRPVSAQDGWLTLANPHWNITLTDAGYSDFLLDNTPGFEGREYLSGEWGAAVGYQLSGGAVVSPLWLEKNFWFPDWVTDCNRRIYSGRWCGNRGQPETGHGVIADRHGLLSTRPPLSLNQDQSHQTKLKYHEK